MDISNAFKIIVASLFLNLSSSIDFLFICFNYKCEAINNDTSLNIY
ncbi:hypothetical protein UUU_25820 [Klebsiella pneumoniae subsp. pneumoniae DSM 30104 = JCM 1662 = NBRC 14940]|nr:hypothetical protein UUU_25820 [Klebsiella pneumoniae subsp. pneumoniae DSM 30104 = JCM 1662 = NBRC 14940]